MYLSKHIQINYISICSNLLITMYFWFCELVYSVAKNYSIAESFVATYLFCFKLSICALRSSCFTTSRFFSCSLLLMTICDLTLLSHWLRPVLIKNGWSCKPSSHEWRLLLHNDFSYFKLINSNATCLLGLCYGTADFWVWLYNSDCSFFVSFSKFIMASITLSIS